jgi:hypothetical protein
LRQRGAELTTVRDNLASLCPRSMSGDANGWYYFGSSARQPAPTVPTTRNTASGDGGVAFGHEISSVR